MDTDKNHPMFKKYSKWVIATARKRYILSLIGEQMKYIGEE